MLSAELGEIFGTNTPNFQDLFCFNIVFESIYTFEDINKLDILEYKHLFNHYIHISVSLVLNKYTRGISEFIQMLTNIINRYILFQYIQNI